MEKEIQANFAATRQTAKVTATLPNMYPVKMEKALKVQVEEMNRKLIPIDGKMVPQTALCLIYKLNLTTSIYV